MRCTLRHHCRVWIVVLSFLLVFAWRSEALVVPGSVLRHSASWSLVQRHACSRLSSTRLLFHNGCHDDHQKEITRKRNFLDRRLQGSVSLRTTLHRKQATIVLSAKSDSNNDENISSKRSNSTEPAVETTETGTSSSSSELPQALKSLVGDNNTKVIQEFWDSYNQRLDKILHQLQTLWELMPDGIRNFRDKFQLGLLSFVAGIVFTVVGLLVPIYQEVESLSEPVTLFETILTDLDRNYVDQVDTNKLFETGITAMLRSLDPYTEFEGKQEASDLTESIEGKYGGVGLVIAGSVPPATNRANVVLPQQRQQPTDDAVLQAPVPDGSNTNGVPEASTGMQDADVSTQNVMDSLEDFDEEEEEEEGLDLETRAFRNRQLKAARDRGIHVVSAFEGYAFDYGLRVGDRLVAIDDTEITDTFSVEDVRNSLRGEPGTLVSISFTREGVKGVQTVTMPRTIVQLRDVKLAKLLGNPENGMGYIQLSGFAANAGAEMRNAILALQQAALEASGGEHMMKGLVLDLRGNPGGLLTSAVDVASLLVPNGSDIVSARGRGFPGVLYRSRIDPIVDTSQTKLAVLVNDRTASAAEIVSGAVQDLDVGIIVGTDRTYGKGLVQNVEDLPFDTALKFTVAKYYTPSGRCIQGIQYTEGGGLNVENSRYKEKKVADKDRAIFYTKRGRQVRDGGGVEADFKVAAPKASALEVTLLRSNLVSDYAAQWSRDHQLTNSFKVDDATYKDFQKFVERKQQRGDIKLEALYTGPMNDLKRVLKQSGYKGSEKELDRLKQSIVREVLKDFDRYESDIKEDIAQSILARYVPESILIARGVKSDVQVNAAVKLLSNSNKFDRLLAKGSSNEGVEDNSLSAVSGTKNAANKEGAKLSMKW